MKTTKNFLQKIIFILLLAAITFACTKEKEPADTPQKDQITIGDASGMILNQNTILVEGGFNSTKTIHMDLDGNSENDMQITMGYGTSPGMGYLYYTSLLHLLHPGIELLHYSSTDTTYKREIVSYHQGDGIIVADITRWYNCRKLAPSYEIDKIEEKNHLMAVEEGQTVSKSDSFLNRGASFIYSSYFEGFDINGDTMFISKTYRTYDCHAIPHQVDLYLAFKITDQGNERLGWIKINFGSTVKATILEIGIQE